MRSHNAGAIDDQGAWKVEEDVPAKHLGYAAGSDSAANSYCRAPSKAPTAAKPYLMRVLLQFISGLDNAWGVRCFLFGCGRGRGSANHRLHFRNAWSRPVVKGGLCKARPDRVSARRRRVGGR